MQNLFSYPIIVNDLSSSEKKYNIKADKDQLKELAELLKVEGVNSFSAEILLKSQKKEHVLTVSGKITAELELMSVISLDNFTRVYAPEFSVVYDTKATLKDIKELDVDVFDDEPDFIIDGTIDLWQVAIEQLALVMEDNPRKDGEVFKFESEFDEEDTEKLNPFSVLKNLKK